jgi:hypothetical protein
MNEDNELVVVKPVDVPALFKEGGCDPVLGKLREILNGFEGDVSTAKGRKEIISFSRRFSTMKGMVDGHGKALIEKEKERLKIVDSERKKFRDECDMMRDEARKPVTDWEDAHKKRVADIEERIEFFNRFLDITYLNSEHVKKDLDLIKGVDINESFEEFELAATKAKAAVVTQLEAKFIVLQNAEKEKAEAERLEKERLEKEQKEREEQIAIEAAEKATREAEEKAKLEADEAERKTNEEKERLEKEKLEEKLKTEAAEREKLEAKERHDKELADSVKATEDRLKREEAEERQRLEKLAENKAHRGKINRAAKSALIKEGFGDGEAEKIITVIAKGLIDHITINY